MRNRLVTIIFAFVLAAFSSSVSAQVVVDSPFGAYSFTGATYNVPISSFVPVNSVSITDGGTIEGFVIAPGNSLAKFSGGSFDMTGGTVHTESNVFWHNNYTNDTISGGTFDTGSIIFSNMQTGGSLNISGGNFPASISIQQYDGDVTISGGPPSATVPNPGPNATLTFIGSNWTFNDPIAGTGPQPLNFIGNQADLTAIGFGTLQGTLEDGTSFQVALGGTGFGTDPVPPSAT